MAQTQFLVQQATGPAMAASGPRSLSVSPKVITPQGPDYAGGFKQLTGALKYGREQRERDAVRQMLEEQGASPAVMAHAQTNPNAAAAALETP